MNWNETLVDGKVLETNVSSIIKNGVEYVVNMEVGKYKKEIGPAMEELRKLPSYNDDEDIDLMLNTKGKLSGKGAKWVNGTHPALHYRGNGLNRRKVWFQKRSGGILAYKYTGWQKRVINATFRVSKSRFPMTSACIDKMQNDSISNHWIATVYEDGNDYIGLHSDKTKTWKKGSCFQVVKWGCARIFEMRLKDHEKPENCTLLFRKILPEGTSMVVDSRTNEITRHGVPVDPACTEPSGSIVGRDIETYHTFEECKKMVEQSRKDRIKRKRKKEEKKANKKVKVL